MKFWYFLLCLLSGAFGANEVFISISNGIHQFKGNDYLGLHTTFISNSIAYGLFNLCNGNCWSYKKNDLIHLDSSTIKVVDINANSNTVLVTMVDYAQIKSDTIQLGIWRDNNPYGVLKKSSIKLIDNSKNTATFRYYKMGHKKTFLFDDDTCIIEGRNLTYLHKV